jgi:hypothetical protein
LIIREEDSIVTGLSVVHESDMTGKYRVIAEGISSKGKIIHGSAVFEVVANKDN